MRRRSTVLAAVLVVAILAVATPAAAELDVPGRTVALAEPGVEGSVYRLYLAHFGRVPDAAGFDFWVRQYVGGRSLSAIAQDFAASSEFARTYGALDAPGFVTLVYGNVLGRSPDPGGFSYWTGRLAAGLSRGGLMVGFSEAPEFVAATGTPPPVAPSAAARAPTPTLYVLGDSVLEGARSGLGSIPGWQVTVDTVESRQFPAGLAVMGSLRDRGRLPDAMVVHLGTNGPFTAADFDAAMAVLAGVPIVAWVTVQLPDTTRYAYERTVNDVIRAGTARHPTAVLVDWNAATAGAGGWFWSDGIHVRPEGAQLAVSLVAAAVRQ